MGIVSSIDVVEELQDDVDLGLDVIEDGGDVSDHQETPLDQPPDQQSVVEPESRVDRVPSPHDIEIQPKETNLTPSDETLTQNFYEKERRFPVLKLDKLRIGSDCISSVNGRVDLNLLKKASPGLLKYVRLGGAGAKGDKNAAAA